jgi:ribonuclease BN (tRNA processing enzyme)
MGDGGAGLTITVLGCDGSWTGPGGAGSGYLMASGPTTLVVDLGPGTFANLQCHVDPAAIDAVLLSHHHADHWSDLQVLAAHAQYASGRRGIPVYAPSGLADRSHLADSPALEWHEVTAGDSVEIGGVTCAFHRTDHAFETLAVRLDGGGRTLGYSADTGPGFSLAELGVGLDLMLCEATYTVEDEGTPGHMSGRQAGEQARRAGARRLVVTHRRPTVDPAVLIAEAAAAFGGPVEQAAIGKDFVL